MSIKLHPSDFQINNSQYFKPNNRLVPNREVYHRFRLSKKELEVIKKNKKQLKEKYDLDFSNVLRFFALNCVDDFDMLWNMGLMSRTSKVLKKRFEAL